MSRMTKFLKQICTYTPAQRDEHGKVVLNKFGEVQYGESQQLKCRREKTMRDVQTGNGAIIKSSTRYYTDELVQISADDLIDGKTVLEVEEYINQVGTTEGYESYV